MNLTLLGAKHCVMGSRYCLEVAGSRDLIDCGMVQERQHASRHWESSPIRPGSITSPWRCQLNVQTMYAHSRRLNKAAKAPTKPAFVCVTSSTSAPGSVSIDLPNGARVHLSTPLDIAALLTQVARLP